MANSSTDDDCCGPDFRAAQYDRGPTDKNPAMFDFETKMADAITARCGKATSDQSGMADLMDKKPSPCPGQS